MKSILPALFLFGFLGCGNPVCQVSGKVVVDGDTPLKEGDIIFEEEDKMVTPAAGKIIEGKYSLTVKPGLKIVRINASRPTKKPDPVMGSAARESMIEEEYNLKSILKVELKPGVQKGLDFKVKSSK